MRKATVLLIAINLAAYIALAMLSGSFEINRYYVDLLGLNRELVLTQRYYWQILTSLFLHFNLAHLSYNMLFLAIFGYSAEEVYGWRRTLLIYLLSGIFVSMTVFVLYPNAVFGGASAAVMGLIGALVSVQKSTKKLIISASLILLFIAFSHVYLPHIAGFIAGFIFSRFSSSESKHA
jgi:rhomboid protease GluP